MNQGYREGIALFNRREFFECHEVLEEVWFAESGPAKRFYQGIIQIAVAFYHYENGNYTGALKLMQRGIERLRPYAPAFGGLDVAALLATLERWRHYLQQPDAAPDNPPPLTIPTLEVQEDAAS